MKKYIETNLYDFIKKRFDIDEIKTLCFKLNIEYESIAAEGKTALLENLLNILPGEA